MVFPWPFFYYTIYKEGSALLGGLLCPRGKVGKTPLGTAPMSAFA